MPQQGYGFGLWDALAVLEMLWTSTVLLSYVFSPPVRWGLLDFMPAIPPDGSVLHRTSTASFWWQCSPPDPHCQNLCQIQCQNLGRIECQNLCQIECQNACQIECQKLCQIECQIECQNLCQIECQKLCQIECQIDRMSESMSDRMSETMSDRMSEFLSSRMSQFICQIECRDRMSEYVMAVISRSEVFFLQP